MQHHSIANWDLLKEQGKQIFQKGISPCHREQIHHLKQNQTKQVLLQTVRSPPSRQVTAAKGLLAVLPQH